VVRSPKPSAIAAQAASPTRSDAWKPAGICGAWHGTQGRSSDRIVMVSS
jgi:hypothetical protein